MFRFWKPGAKYARASFADAHLRRMFGRGLRFDAPKVTDFKVLSTEGGADNWEVNWQVQTEAPASELLTLINDKLATDGKWARLDAGKTAETTRSLWKFTDEKGGTWNGTASVQPLPGERNRLTVTLKIDRVRRG